RADRGAREDLRHGCPPPPCRRPCALRDRYAAGMSATASDRPLRTAEILSIGAHLTVAETRDTNAGELAAARTAEGVVVGRIVALPDRLDLVSGAFRSAFERS